MWVLSDISNKHEGVGISIYSFRLLSQWVIYNDEVS